MAIKTPLQRPVVGHPTAPALQKLVDANQALVRAEALWHDYMMRERVQLEVIRDEAEHSFAAVARVGAPPPVAELNAALRICIHDAHSALNNLITQLARKNHATAHQLRAADFPIVTSEEVWAKVWDRKLGGLPAETIRRVREVQPFTGGPTPGPAHPLELLHVLWNTDKHGDGFTVGVGISPRALTSVVAQLQMRFEPSQRDSLEKAFADVDRTFDVDLGPIIDGTRVFEIRLPKEISLDNVQTASVTVPVTVGLVGPSVAITDPAITVLRNAVRYARETVLYVAEVVDTAPAAFPPGFVTRSKEPVVEVGVASRFSPISR